MKSIILNSNRGLSIYITTTQVKYYVFRVSPQSDDNETSYDNWSGPEHVFTVSVVICTDLYTKIALVSYSQVAFIHWLFLGLYLNRRFLKLLQTQNW